MRSPAQHLGSSQLLGYQLQLTAKAHKRKEQIHNNRKARKTTMSPMKYQIPKEQVPRHPLELTQKSRRRIHTQIHQQKME